MASNVEPSPLGALSKMEEASSALLNRKRLKSRHARRKANLKFKESAVWHFYESYGCEEFTGEESTREQGLKEHVELAGWVHLW